MSCKSFYKSENEIFIEKKILHKLYEPDETYF